MKKDRMLRLKNWAIVGVTPDQDRFGYKIWKQMQDRGYNVYGVNPNYDEIDGIKIYPSLKEVDGPVDAVDIVVGPEHVPAVLDVAKEKGIDNIFFQPGSYDMPILKMAEEMGFTFIEGDCLYETLEESAVAPDEETPLRRKEEMLGLKNWAIVGVTPKKDRFGYKIWKQMREKGYTVYGVNPNYDEIEGEKIYASLKEIQEPIDAVDIIVGPAHVPAVLDIAKEKGIENIFFQPGSYDMETLEMARGMGFNYIEGDCVYASLLKKEYLNRD